MFKANKSSIRLSFNGQCEMAASQIELNLADAT